MVSVQVSLAEIECETSCTIHRVALMTMVQSLPGVVGSVVLTLKATSRAGESLRVKC